ncbi:MAG: DUF58 domain-containing protein [Gammaproteobacteria bacterium]
MNDDALPLKERFKLSRFFKGEKAAPRPVRLNHRRIFILPTQRGMNFAVLIVLLLLIAFVYNNNLAYLLAFLAASIFFITILHSFKGLYGLIVRKGQSQPVFAGETAGFEIHIDNPSAVERIHLQLQVADGQIQTVAIAPYAARSVTVYDMTRRRGWHELGTVTVSSRYPLGFFRAWSPLNFGMKTLVYPRPARSAAPFPESAGTASEHGYSKQGTDDFQALHEYQPGDSIKQIHWKAYAKGLGLFSKQYGGGKAREIWLDYSYAPGADVEERLSQLCRWVLDAEQAALHYGLKLPGCVLQPGSGSAHAAQCLEALALFNL